MAVLYISDTDISAHLDTAVWQALFTLDGGSYDATAQSLQLRARQVASARARSVAKQLGFEPGDTEDPDDVDDDSKWLALCFFLETAFSRKGRAMPETLQTSVNETLQQAKDGFLEFATLTPSSEHGVGGITATDSSTTSSTGKPPIMNGLRKVF